MRCYSYPVFFFLNSTHLITNWCKNTHIGKHIFFQPAQLTVCLSLPVSLSQEAFVELYDRQRDSVFSCSWPSIKTVFGVAALGAASLTIGAYLAQKWTSPSSSSSSLSFLILLLRLAPLLLPFKDAPDPSETTFRLLRIWLSSKTSLKKTPSSSSLHVKTETNQNNWSNQMNSPYRAKHILKRGSLDVITLIWVQLKRKVFFFVVLPASVLVIAWMLSVSVDVACVRSHVGPLYGGPGDGGAGTVMPYTGEEAAAALPLLVRVKNPFWTVDSSYPPCSQTFKGLPAQNSCSECIMEIACYNQRVVCLLHSLLRQLQWTLNTPLYSP